MENFNIKTNEIEELVSEDIIGTQSLEEAIETADEIERKLKECDLKSMTDEEALKEIADLANEIDLSWFKQFNRHECQIR